jgi:hypothetical protein
MRSRTKKMKTSASIRILDPLKRIKIQLDPRTVVTVKDMSAFEVWLSNFPNARIIPN